MCRVRPSIAANKWNQDVVIVSAIQQNPNGKPGNSGPRPAYDLMRAAHGHQGWWPGETPFEVCVGAILTQNTSWRNVEKAIARLRARGVLNPEGMHALSEEALAELIRPAGCFHVKARRLRAFLHVLMEHHQGNLELLFGGETAVVRQRLLAISGIGPETADSMLLYAGRHPSFVVDAYTRRIFSRHGWCRTDMTYDELRSLCIAALTDHGVDRLDLWQDYHAQIVAVGKDFCRPQEPRCNECPLRTLLPEGRPAPKQNSPQNRKPFKASECKDRGILLPRG